MRKLIQTIKESLNRSREARVDAYAAQTAFYIIMGFIPFIMLLLMLIPYTPVTEANVMELCRRFFRSVLGVSGRNRTQYFCAEHGDSLRNGHCMSLGMRQRRYGDHKRPQLHPRHYRDKKLFLPACQGRVLYSDSFAVTSAIHGTFGFRQ